MKRQARLIDNLINCLFLFPIVALFGVMIYAIGIVDFIAISLGIGGLTSLCYFPIFIRNIIVK